MQEYARKSLFVGPQPIPAPSRPIEHLVARDTADGTWQIAISDGRKFEPAPLSLLGAARVVVSCQRRFQWRWHGGPVRPLDRRLVVAWRWRTATRSSFVHARSNCRTERSTMSASAISTAMGSTIWRSALPTANGGSAFPTALRFTFQQWARWTVRFRRKIFASAISMAMAAPISPGSMRTSGDWLVSQSDGGKFSTRVWGTFGPGVDWPHILAADFSGHGRTDVAAWNPATGDWKFGESDGRHFVCNTAGHWPTDADWQHVSTGRFGDDRPRESSDSTKIRAGSRSPLSKWICRRTAVRDAAISKPSALDGGIHVGAFNGDARDNLAGWTKSGEIWVGILDRTSIRFEKWGNWPTASHLDEGQVMSFWRQRR